MERDTMTKFGLPRTTPEEFEQTLAAELNRSREEFPPRKTLDEDPNVSTSSEAVRVFQGRREPKFK